MVEFAAYLLVAVGIFALILYLTHQKNKRAALSGDHASGKLSVRQIQDKLQQAKENEARDSADCRGSRKHTLCLEHYSGGLNTGQ
jgi:hypothetical protein